jgi:hypothetical protein
MWDAGQGRSVRLVDMHTVDRTAKLAVNGGARWLAADGVVEDEYARRTGSRGSVSLWMPRIHDVLEETHTSLSNCSVSG